MLACTLENFCSIFMRLNLSLDPFERDVEVAEGLDGLRGRVTRAASSNHSLTSGAFALTHPLAGSALSR